MAAEGSNLLVDLARSRALPEAQRTVARLEKSLGFRWRAVGDRESNCGTIGLGSDSGNALIERVTNAIDAVIEREALRQGRDSKAMPASPREGIERWFGVPGGRISHLKDLQTRQQLADNVVVRLYPGSSRRQPTVEVADAGVGLTAALIPKTILSLNESNKLDKPYLAGAYGQGGSTVLAFSPLGTLFVSRRQPDLLAGERDQVAVTFARYNELDARTNKNGRYEYLVDSNGHVASISPALVRGVQPGTSVVHFDMQLDRYSAVLTAPTGSLWWILQNALFDPVLPFWAEDHRQDDKKPTRRTIVGNFNRLQDDKKDRIEHSDQIRVRVPRDDGDTHVRVNYWVVKERPDERNSQPIDAYVDPYRPVAYTYFGQTHGTDERRFVAERLALPYLKRFLIVQVELDDVTPHARRDLFSSTRDRLKQGAFFDQMREEICTGLSADADLIRLNDERKQQLLATISDKEREKMKERFARLMENMSVGIDASAGGSGIEGSRRPPSASSSREPLKPLETREEPSFIRIANTQRPIPIFGDRHSLLRLESDAPDGFISSHVHARLTAACAPNHLAKEGSQSDFRGGRARITLRTESDAKPGAEGTLTVFLFTPGGQSFSDSIKFLVEENPRSAPGGSAGKANVSVPEPIPVTESGWEELRWSNLNVAEVQEDHAGVKIFVNVDNRHLVRLLRSTDYQETGVKRMRTNFLLYVAFYAWAQHRALQREASGLEGERLEEYKVAELDRVAQTVVHSISSIGRLSDEEQS